MTARVMKSVSAAFVLSATWAGAEVVYSNDFSGTEFRVSGVGDAVIGDMIESGGRLVPTNSNANTVGFRVDLTALGLATNPAVAAVKLTITGKAPLVADGTSYLGLAFQSVGNFNVNGNGNPVIAINGNGTLRAAGGVGFATNALSNVAQGTNFTSGGEFSMSLLYNKSGTIDVWYNEVQVHTNQAISSTDDIELKHAVVGFRKLSTEEGANLDAVTIELLGDGSASAGEFQVDLIEVEAAGDDLVATVELSSTNEAVFAFILEYTPNLPGSSWMPVATNDLQAPGGLFVHTNAAPVQAAFYRVRAE